MTGFRINEPNVVYEAFDEEIVVVNLETGNYYSLTGTAPPIWIDLVDGFGPDETARRLQHRHTGEFEVIAAAVSAFAEHLVNEQLLARAHDVVARPRGEATGPTGERTPFVAPLIKNYEDMQDLLMLDPIHEVDSAGWPVAKNPG